MGRFKKPDGLQTLAGRRLRPRKVGRKPKGNEYPVPSYFECPGFLAASWRGSPCDGL